MFSSIKDSKSVPTRTFVYSYVEQAVNCINNLLADICGQLNLNLVRERQLVQKAEMDILSVTKDKLIIWLESVCYPVNT